MTHLFGKELLIQFTVRCFVNFSQVFAGNFCFWGQVVPHADLLFVASYESMRFEYIYITLYALFNASCDNAFAHAKAHARILNFSCLLCTGYCSVLPVNWLLRVLYFAWLLIKGSSFVLVSHVDGKRVHNTKCNEWMQNRIRSLRPTSYTKL